MIRKRVTFQSEDGVTIVGDWCRTNNTTEWAALLLHMMPADRMSWRGFDDSLTRRNISSLAIDLRGHGESTRREDEHLDYHEFADIDHQQSLLDLTAAQNWLSNQDIAPGHVLFVGASIGANLALAYLGAHPQFGTAVLLSPGMEYRGIQAEPALRALRPEQSLLFVASRNDYESAQSVADLDRIAMVPHEVIWLEGDAHGTDMLASDPMLGERIADWLEERCRRP